MDHHVSRNPSAKGRIAQVLAQARASLLEPTRPITPASLDARTSLDNYKFNASQSSFRPNVLISRSMQLPSAAVQQMVYVPSVPASMASDVDENRLSSKKEQNIRLLLCDISDISQYLTGALVEKDQTNLLRMVETLPGTIDAICKQYKLISNLNPKEKEEFGRTVIALIRSLVLLTSAKFSVTRFEISRHILRISNLELSTRRGSLDFQMCCDLFTAIQCIYTSDKSDVPPEIYLSFTDLLLELLAGAWTRIEGDILSRGRNTPDSLESSSKSQSNSRSEGAMLAFLEALTVAAAVLRTSTTEESNKKRLLHLGIIENLEIGLGKCGTFALVCGKEPHNANLLEKLSGVAVQLTAIARNYCVDSNARSQMLSTKLVNTLCRILQPFRDSPELVLNCVRVTAKLSLYEPFRAQLNKKPDHIERLEDIIRLEVEKCKSLMEGGSPDSTSRLGKGDEEESDDDLLWPDWSTWPVLSRVAFTLGNLTTSNDSNRKLLGKDLGPLIVLLEVCASTLSQLGSESDGILTEEGDEDSSHQQQVTSQQHESPGEQRLPNILTSSEKEIWDATIKMLRLLANLCIEPSVGQSLSTRPSNFQLLLKLLACGSSGSLPEHEELLLNVVAACTNLTFYACTETVAAGSSESAKLPSQQRLRDQLNKILVSLSLQLSHCLFHSNDEIVLETARALGNLTRNANVLQSLCLSRTDEALVLLLSHSDVEVVTAVTGALVNLSADPRSRSSLMSSANPANVLVKLLRRSSLKQIQLSSLICQVFHNILLHTESKHELLSTGCSEMLSCTLGELVECAIQCQQDTFNRPSSAAAMRKSGQEQAVKAKYRDFVDIGRRVLTILETSFADDPAAK